jgi:hypothetical protein
LTILHCRIVLPKPIGDRLVAELDKRLDLDIDDVLDTPKLRIKLSPAELDKQLLELYDTLSESPGGDVLRILGGGGQIGLQNLYLKRNAERGRWRKLREKLNGPGGYKNQTIMMSLIPSFAVDDVTTEEFQRTAAQWVRYSLRKNQLKLARSLNFGTATKRVQPELKDRKLKARNGSDDAISISEIDVKTIIKSDDQSGITNLDRDDTDHVLYRKNPAPLDARSKTTTFSRSTCAWNSYCRIPHSQPPNPPSFVKFSLLI